MNKKSFENVSCIVIDKISLNLAAWRSEKFIVIEILHHGRDETGCASGDAVRGSDRRITTRHKKQQKKKTQLKAKKKKYDQSF